jgi:hypothetical protein
VFKQAIIMNIICHRAPPSPWLGLKGWPTSLPPRSKALGPRHPFFSRSCVPFFLLFMGFRYNWENGDVTISETKHGDE